MPDADAVSSAPVKGQPRSPEAAATLARHDHVMQIPIVLSAILPLIVAPQQGHPISVVIGIVSWLVFLYDFVIHRRYLHKYTSTGFGKFDLAIVILTAPWFLLPGAQGGSFVVLLRLARLMRVLIVSRGARKLFSQLGRVAIVAISVVVIGAAVAYYAEHPTNPEFATFGDAVWWGVVTLTTVGYGDVVPITSTGRWAGVFIMITGVGVLGVLAGSLASFFRLQSKASGEDAEAEAAGDDVTPDDAPAPTATTNAAPTSLDAVLTELQLLRTQLATLTQRLNGP